jgi:hypothetical protein
MKRYLSTIASELKSEFSVSHPATISAHKTHALLSLQTHEMVVEYNHRGPKASDIVSLCQNLARQNRAWQSLDLTVTPVVEASFLRALDRFRVIKLATVKVARPNPGWTRDFKNLMGEMAEDSDARLADVTLHASRNGTLSKTQGIIAYLRDMLSGRAPSVEGATIWGIREGEDADSSVSLNKFVQRQIVNVRKTSDGYVDDEDIEGKIRDYLETRERRR